MRFSVFTILSAFSGVALGHFRLLYPPPRGEFVSDKEPDFCGGYTNPTNNRTTFPLTGGFWKIQTGHDGAGGVIISTRQNTTSFDDFSVNGNQQIVSQFAEIKGGTACIPFNLTGHGVDVKDGDNVTIQVVLGGSDGQLYQCADLTLSSSVRIPDSVSCKNETGGHDGDDHDDDDHDDDHGSHSGSATPSATAPSGSSPSASPAPGNGSQRLQSLPSLLFLAMIAVIAVGI